MQRFIRERKTSYLRNVIISVLIFLLIFAGFGCGLTAMNKKMDQEEMQTLQNAITRNVTTCYTLEGSYPQSLGYLKKHYGLHYDENKYFVDYQPLGANIMPDITIIRKEADHRRDSKGRKIMSLTCYSRLLSSSYLPFLPSLCWSCLPIYTVRRHRK